MVSHQRRFFFFSFDINHFPRQKSQYVWSEIKTEQAKSLVPIYHRHYQFYMHRCMSATTKTSLKVIDQPRNWVLGKILRIRKKSDFHSRGQNSNEMLAAHQKNFIHLFPHWKFWKSALKLVSIELFLYIFCYILKDSKCTYVLLWKKFWS